MSEKDESEKEEFCAICGTIAKQKCSGCRTVHYCSREHQKLDWRKHSKVCRSFKLAVDNKLGRHYVATRKIEPGMTLMREKSALVASPPQDTPPVCLGCYALLTAKNCRACDKCGWPLCQECDGHGPECEFTVKNRETRINVTDFGIPHPTYRVIGIVRALSLRDERPELYRKFLELEDHCLEASKRIFETQNSPKDVARFVKKFFNVDDVNEEEIAKIAGILQVNGHEVPTSENPHIAVYDEASYLEHNCRANCSKSFTENGGIVIRAAVPISKGEHLSICYADPLWGVTNRRHYLVQTKFFECTCQRCKDPTEFGTMFNAIKCIKNDCSGYMLPPTFIVSDEKYPDYVCSKCKATKSWESVDAMLEKIGIELSKMKKDDVESSKKFVQTYASFLHENHFYNVDVKLALAMMIGQQKGGLPEISNELLNEKIMLCKKLGTLFEILVPAENRVRGMLLFEMHAGIAELARRQNPDTSCALLIEAKKILEESYHLLRHEPEILPEGKIARQAQRNLIDMDVIIKALLEKTTGPT